MQDYVFALSKVNEETLRDMALSLELTTYYGGRIFTAGNGGSFCIAQHFAADLLWGAVHPEPVRNPVINLGSNIAGMTALANDSGYCNVFRHELLWHGVCPSDTVVVFSVSGTSANILEVAGEAYHQGCNLFSLTGRSSPQLEQWGCNIAIEPELEYGTPIYYAVCESVFSCLAHEIARQYHELRQTIGNRARQRA